jgi:predicted nucleic acid-binding protein
MESVSNEDIQAAFDENRPIQLNQPTVLLQLVNKTPADVERAAEWLKQNLNDQVRAVTLSLTYCGFLTATVEKTLYEITQTRKNVEILVQCDEYSVFEDTTLNSKSRTRSAISSTLSIHDDIFQEITPRGVLDALSAGGTVALPTYPFRSVILEKDNPASPSQFTGIWWTIEDNVSERYMEVVSKLPNLKTFTYDYRGTNPDQANKLFQYLHANALTLQELIITVPCQIPTAINELIVHSETLKVLSISQNQVQGPEEKKFLELNSLAHNRSIEELELNFSGDQIESVIEPLRQNKSITSIKLQLHDINLNDKDTTHIEEFLKMLAEKNWLRHLEIRKSGEGDSCRLFLTALKNKNITSLRINDLDITDDQVEAAILANPHLTSFDIITHSNYQHIPEKFKTHIECNKKNRNEFQINLITILYNIARTHLDQFLSYLPRDVWCIIMSYIVYPGVEQPFEEILRDLLKNSSIRRVLRKN